MSRTHHRTDPAVARWRRALKTSTDQIEKAWTFTGWRYHNTGREKARDFRAYMRDLDDDAWWSAVTNVRPWLPRWSR